MTLQEIFSNDNFKSIIYEQLEKLAKESPDFKYCNSNDVDINCRYDCGPNEAMKSDGCIFGQAFQRLGVTKEKLKEYAFCSIGGICNSFNKPVPKGWMEIQAKQDGGHPWGEIV